MPGATAPPYGGWFDAVAERLDEVVSASGAAGAVTKVVVHRGEITFHVQREHLLAVMQNLRDDAALRFELVENLSSVANSGRRSTLSQKATHSRSFCKPSITILPSPAGNGP